MVSHIGQRLHSARQSQFVGRVSEQEFFQLFLTEQRTPYNVFFLYGPGGIGKTALLYRMAYLCSQQGVVTHYLDARNIEPTPEAFLETLQRAYETITPLDDWFREVFLPQLPENAVVVVASRHSPSIAWRTDPGWQTLIRQIPLRNLSPDESRTYLKQRSVPEDQYPKILDFTHGHPLALSLIADVLTQRPGTLFQPDESPDVIRALMDELVSKVPSPAHRAALEICSLVRLTTESLVTEVLKK
jgi:ATP/maltotriose-dependent transcriptional regulator MalT